MHINILSAYDIKINYINDLFLFQIFLSREVRLKIPDLSFASNIDGFSFASPAPIKINLGFRAGINPSSGVVVLGSAFATSFLRNSHNTITMSTVENNSPEIVEIRRSGTEGRKVIDGTFVRRTPDVKRSSKAFFVIKIVFGIENEGTSIFSIRKKSV